MGDPGRDQALNPITKLGLYSEISAEIKQAIAAFGAKPPRGIIVDRLTNVSQAKTSNKIYSCVANARSYRRRQFNRDVVEPTKEAQADVASMNWSELKSDLDRK